MATAPGFQSFQTDIPQTNLSRDNMTIYKNLVEHYKKVVAIDSEMEGIGVRTTASLSSTLAEGISDSIVRASIAGECFFVQETQKRIAEVFEAAGGDEAVIENEGKKPYSFESTYSPAFLQKIKETANGNSYFYKLCAIGVREQYKAVKKYIESKKRQKKKIPDFFLFANLFTMESISENDFALPLLYAEQEIALHVLLGQSINATIHMLKNTDKTTQKMIATHYALLKDAFQRNIINIILEAPNQQYMYEAFVRTDLLRWQIKSLNGDLKGGRSQLLFLARLHDDQKMMTILDHLMQATLAHRHVDDTNSGTFTACVYESQGLLRGVKDATQHDKANYTAEKLAELVGEVK